MHNKKGLLMEASDVELVRYMIREQTEILSGLIASVATPDLAAIEERLMSYVDTAVVQAIEAAQNAAAAAEVAVEAAEDAEAAVVEASTEVEEVATEIADETTEQVVSELPAVLSADEAPKRSGGIWDRKILGGGN